MKHTGINMGILIEHFNGVKATTTLLRKHLRDATISALTRAEVLTGFDEIQRALPARLLDTFGCLPLDQATTDLTAHLRRENHWKLPDAIQEAIAQHHDLKLVTRNFKDFPAEVFDFVLIPYSL